MGFITDLLFDGPTVACNNAYWDHQYKATVKRLGLDDVDTESFDDENPDEEEGKDDEVSKEVKENVDQLISSIHSLFSTILYGPSKAETSKGEEIGEDEAVNE